MQQRVALPLAAPWRAADDDQGRALGIGLRDGVRDLEAPDAISDDTGADSLKAGVCVGGEARPLLVAGVDELDRALLDLRAEGEAIVAGDAEDVADALLKKPPHEMGAYAFAHIAVL
jgi:hypothetical protein